MHFDFSEKSLGVMCNCQQTLTKRFGQHASLIIRRLLFSLRCAPTLADLPMAPPISRREANCGHGECYAIGSPGLASIFFVAENQNQLPANAIKRVTIIKIGEPHD